LKNKIIQVLGPTGVGKSQIAILLALEFKGEIISADSMQVYKDFTIGTAKLRKKEMQEIPHHLIDVVAGCTQFNAAMFLKESFKISENIIKRGHIPIICGGTALYLRSMIKGIFPETREKKVTREHLEDLGRSNGIKYLWNILNEIDPKYAEKIGINDKKRIIRALDIYYNQGLPPSQLFLKTKTPFENYGFIRIGLTMDRKDLYRRIEERVDKMIKSGFLDEVKKLRLKYPLDCPPFFSLGYKELGLFLEQAIDLEEAITLIKQHTRNYAKRQLSWFRQEKDIQWFDPRDIRKIQKYIKKGLEE
jgi:tRNA dimethylallyltransferase